MSPIDIINTRKNSPQENLVFKNNKKIKICNRIAIRKGNKRNSSLRENN
jgi:hypothetical protein